MLKAEYVAVVVALIALIIAIYALVTQPPHYSPPPSASATVVIADRVVVETPGVYTVSLGWIHIKDAPAVVELSANYTHIWFLLNNVRYSNPAVVTLQPGNYTVSAIVSILNNGTKINISYRVLG